MKHQAHIVDRRAVVFQSDSLGGKGRIVALVRNTGNEAPKLADAVAKFIGAVDSFDKKNAQQREAATGSWEKEQQVVAWASGERARLRAQAHEVRAMIDADRQATTDARKNLLRPPEISSGDAAGALRDRETRERFAALPDAAKDALRAQMAKGEADDVLLALSRDVLPTGDRQHASGLWANRMRKVHAEALAAHDASDEANDGLSASVGSLENLLSL